MKKYDYLVVGAGLYGAVFAQQAKEKGKKVLVIDKRPHIAGNVYTNMVRISSTRTTKRYGIILRSLQSSTGSRIHRLQITKASFTACRLTCTHLIKCGVW